MEAALKLLKHPVPQTSAALLLGIARQALKQGVYFLGSSRSSEGAARINAEEREALLEANHAYRALAEVYYFLEGRSLFLFAGLYSANLAQHLGRSAELLAANGIMCMLAGNIPIHRLADSYGRRVFELVEENEDLHAKSWACFTTAYYYIYVGSWSKAAALAEQGADSAAQIGYGRNWEHNVVMSAMNLLPQGKFRQALSYYDDLTVSARRREDVQTLIWGLTGQVASRLWFEDYSQAILDDLEEAKSLLLSRNTTRSDRIRTVGLSAMMNLRAGNEQLAREEAQKALDMAAQSGLFNVYAREGYEAVVDVFLTLWEKTDDQETQVALATSARQGLTIIRPMGRLFPVIAPRTWMLQGRYEWLSGKPNKAQKAWRKSIELARDLGMSHDEGLAFYEYGRSLPPGDPDRERHLQRAIELFSEVEAAYYLDLAQKELQGER